MRDMVLYTKMNELGIEIEDIEICLSLYVFKHTKELMQYLKANLYTIHLDNLIYEVIDNELCESQKYEHLEFTYDEVDSLEYVTNCTEENAFSVGTIAAAGFNFSIFEEKYSDDGDISYYDYDFAQAMIVPRFKFYYDDVCLDELQLGVFHVDSYEKEDEMIKFICLDNAKFLDKKIKKYVTETIKLPQSMKNVISGIVTSACKMSMSEVNAEIAYPTITNLSGVKNMTARTILSYMLELIGAFGYFNNRGAFTYKMFNKNNGQDVMIPIDRVMEYKRNGYSAIMNGARLSYGDDVGVGSFSWLQEYIPADIDGDGEDEETESPIPLSEDNPILKGKDNQECQTILHNLLDRMRNFNFKPGEVTTILPDFRIEPGDFVAVEDKLQYTRKFLASQITYRDNLEMEIVSAWDGETYNIKNDGSVFVGKKSIALLNNSLLSSFLFKLKGGWEEDKRDNYTKIICKKETFKEELIENEEDYADVTEGEGTKVYAYRDNDTIVICSEADILSPHSGDSENLFSDFIRIDTLDLSMLDTSNISNMQSMFRQVCFMPDTQSVSINWGNYFDTRKVYNMSYMFSNFGHDVEELALDLSHFNTSNVSVMTCMFSGTGANSEKFELNISNFNMENASMLNSMFSGTAKKANNAIVHIGDFYTLNAVDMSYMFYECNIEIINTVVTNQSFTTINVTNMNNMFAGVGENSNDIILDLTKLDTSNVNNMERMFAGVGLNSTNFVIKLGKGFDMSKAEYKDKMFENHGISKILCPKRGIPLMLREVYDGVIETYE
ncbi:MAG: BspA family leucine-rich repeat surface protein [Lachnospiraceae bacterium]|nr:BspA family leucine-rich repeat surface protein [Lachnospiraceae bacterium]